MKKILLAAFLFPLSTAVFGQITLEHTYDSTAYSDQATIHHTQLSTGYKYWGLVTDFNTPGEGTLTVYNLDHSLYKQVNITIPNVPGDTISNGFFDVAYVSDKLFDTDTGLEFMCILYGRTSIMDEDGSVLLNAINQFPYNYYDGHADIASTEPIFNTPSGTKMILTGNLIEHTKAFVYSLPGELPNTTAIVSPEADKYNINLYPNPASDYIKIKYSLPSNVKIAQVNVYDMNGKVIKTYKVDNTFNDILIDTRSLNSGTYVCRVYSNEQTLSETKFVVTK